MSRWHCSCRRIWCGRNGWRPKRSFVLFLLRTPSLCPPKLLSCSSKLGRSVYDPTKHGHGYNAQMPERRLPYALIAPRSQNNLPTLPILNGVETGSARAEEAIPQHKSANIALESTTGAKSADQYIFFIKAGAKEAASQLGGTEGGRSQPRKPKKNRAAFCATLGKTETSVT